jgi:hypothetical protein
MNERNGDGSLADGRRLTLDVAAAYGVRHIRGLTLSHIMNR